MNYQIFDITITAETDIAEEIKSQEIFENVKMILRCSNTDVFNQFNESLTKDKSIIYQKSKITVIDLTKVKCKIPSEFYWNFINLETLILPENIKTIQVSNFESYYIFKKVILPTTVSGISSNAFSLCSSLETIEIRDKNNIKKIGKSAFMGAGSLKAIDTSKVIIYGEGAFKNCVSLDNIVLSPELNELAESLFYGCISLSEIKLPETVRVIPKRTFSKCSSLEKIYIPESVEIIDEEAFADCLLLKQVTGCKSVEEVLNNAFKKCYVLQYFEGLTPLYTIDNNILESSEKDYTNENESTTEDENESYVNKNIESKLKIIGDSAFEFTALEEIILPDSIKEIGMSAFSETKNLVTIYINENNSNPFKIKERCFFNSSIERTNIYKRITEIPLGLFYGCKNLEYFDFSSIINIESEAFLGTKIPLAILSVKDIPLRGFLESGIISVTINEGCENICAWAFCGTPLREIRFCKSLREIGNSAFKDTYITEVDLSNTKVQKIGGEAFRNCKFLQKIKCSNYTKEIGNSAFCETLIEKLIIPDNFAGAITFGSSCFRNCKELKCFDNSKFKCKNITTYMFAGCKKLTDINLEGIETIECKAFDNNKTIKNILIPHNMQQIASDSFYNCKIMNLIFEPSRNNKLNIQARAFRGSYIDTFVMSREIENSCLKNFAFDELVVSKLIVNITKSIRFKNLMFQKKRNHLMDYHKVGNTEIFSFRNPYVMFSLYIFSWEF